MNIIDLIKGFINFVPQLLIFALCIYYLVRKKSADGILLSIGSFIGLLVSFIYIFLVPFLISRNVIGFTSGRITVFDFVAIIGVIGSLAFAVGLFLLIQDNIKCRQSSK